ncbi:hypothetical protein HDU67_007201 [Dinochytrium kinnereticum]|nr:hypothetical protein HDU67_007201 [Dinochytrium kinnereticum]
MDYIHFLADQAWPLPVIYGSSIGYLIGAFSFAVIQTIYPIVPSTTQKTKKQI